MDKKLNYSSGAPRVAVMFAAALVAVMVCAVLEGCGQAGPAQDSKDISAGLVYESSLETEYAEEFTADFYEGGYTLLTIADGSRFLLVPEGSEAPDDLASGVTVLQQPVSNIYLVASAAMSSFADLGALDMIRFSGTRQSDWYIEDAAAAMADGSILYAGKYSAPDYEKILAEGCGLCIENTMILHTPEVKENLEKFGIPVMVDYSSYEKDPLGRCEWVKFYGILTGKQDEAAQIFDGQKKYIDDITARLSADGISSGDGAEQSGAGASEGQKGSESSDNERATVAYFYINSNGSAVVRKGDDYIPEMIEMAGGKYIFSELGVDDGKATSNVNMQMEKFYEGARDVDYIIYNSTIDGEIMSIDELVSKAPLLADIKAVKNGNVYCTGKNFYQETNVCGIMVSDIYSMLRGSGDMMFLKKVE